MCKGATQPLPMQPPLISFQYPQLFINLYPSLLFQRSLHKDLQGPGGAFGGDSEGDIVKASLAYILLPIYEILNILYYGKFKMSTEFSHKLPVELLGDEVEDGEEKQLKESVLRTDEIFAVSQGQPDAGEAICVIEYKRRKLLRYKDWRNAMLPPDYTNKQYGRVMKDSQGKTRSGLHQNAPSYTKQVAAYASRTKCKHAAILNRDHALFFEFNKLAGALKNSAGEEANLIWVTGDTEFKETYVAHDFLREFMPGWTLRAFKDRFGYWPLKLCQHKDEMESYMVVLRLRLGAWTR
jgi:hypothetical protein